MALRDEGHAPPVVTHLSLVTADRYRLGAVHYAAHGKELGALVLAGATAVPQTFYRRFAEHASSRGFTMLTFDYRGIGMSRPPSLYKFQASFLDWARLDLAAAIDAMRVPGRPLHVIGHSFGGQAIGLLPDPSPIERACLFGVGAGWRGWMPLSEQLRVTVLWSVMAPLMARWKGYLPLSLLNMGEDLPLGVYRDWRRWCGYPHYFFDDPAMSSVAAGFDQVKSPIVAITALDDRWAGPKSRDAFMRGYRNAHWRPIDLSPENFSFARIGHMGYFRRGAQPLWDQALDWLELPGRSAELLVATG